MSADDQSGWFRRHGEDALQIGLMLGVGGVAAAASWAHIVALAAEHGQGGWLAYADAAVIETAALSAGLEIRRRKRTGQPVWGVAVVLVAAVALQLAAQLAAAELSVWGWLLGAVPAVAFLVLAKLALARRRAELVDVDGRPLRSDDELVYELVRELPTDELASLTRYRVEQLTGASRRQAERVLNALTSDQVPTWSDQVA